MRQVDKERVEEIIEDNLEDLLMEFVERNPRYAPEGFEWMTYEQAVKQLRELMKKESFNKTFVDWARNVIAERMAG